MTMDTDEIPRELVTGVFYEIELAEEAIKDDVFYTRDPNDAAMLLCYQKKLVKIKYCKQMVYGRREPQKVVHFGFAGHDEIYKFVVNSKLNMQSSLVYTNVNVGELRHYNGLVKSILHSIT